MRAAQSGNELIVGQGARDCDQSDTATARGRDRADRRPSFRTPWRGSSVSSPRPSEVCSSSGSGWSSFPISYIYRPSAPSASSAQTDVFVEKCISHLIFYHGSLGLVAEVPTIPANKAGDGSNARPLPRANRCSRHRRRGRLCAWEPMPTPSAHSDSSEATRPSPSSPHRSAQRP
jgi:hypothetical protein